MGKCDKCGEDEHALHITKGHYKFLCRICYCELYRDCINQCSFTECPNRKEIKE